MPSMWCGKAKHRKETVLRAFSLLTAIVMVSAAGVSTIAQPLDNPVDQMCFFGGSKPNHIPAAIDVLTQDSTAKRIATAHPEAVRLWRSRTGVWRANGRGEAGMGR